MARYDRDDITSYRQAIKERFIRNLRLHDLFLLRGFMLLLVVFCIMNVIHKERVFSENENRNLAVLPKFTVGALLNGEYEKDLENALTDQFFGRDQWITFKITLDRIMGRKEANGVYLAKDKYLIQIPEDPDQENLDKTLSSMADFASRHEDLRITTIMVPNAASVLADKLPANAPVRSQKSDLEYINNAMPENMALPDVTSILEKYTDEDLYYRTDHHWTSRAAKHVFEETADTLGIESPVSYKEYPVTEDFEGTLASKSGVHRVKDPVSVYAPVDSNINYYVLYEDKQEKCSSMYDISALDKKDKYTVFFGGNHPIITIQTTAYNDRVLLLVKDSYANCFVQFLTPYYEQIVMIDPRYYYDNIENLLSYRKVTDVLFLYNLDTFLSDTSLADALNVIEGTTVEE